MPDCWKQIEGNAACDIPDQSTLSNPTDCMDKAIGIGRSQITGEVDLAICNEFCKPFELIADENALSR